MRPDTLAPPVVNGLPGSDPRSAGRRTLPQLLQQQARLRGTSPFMRVKRHGIWHAQSWQEVADQVLILAHALKRGGIQPGDVVAMISENLPELYLLEYAAQTIGAAVTCLYPDASAEELDYIVSHCGASWVVAQDQEQVDKVLGLQSSQTQVTSIIYLEDRGLWDYSDSRLRSYDHLLRSGSQPSAEETQALQDRLNSSRDDEIAVLCYTSGTTGRPKGVVMTHRYLADNAYRLVSSFEIPRDIAYLSYISPAWAAEQITGLALALIAPSVVHFSEKAETVQADLREIGPQFLLFTPRQWEMMASAVEAAMLDAPPWRQRLVAWGLGPGSQHGLSSFMAERLVRRAIRDNLGLKFAKVALSAGSGMSAQVFRRFHAMGVPLRNLYGSTEYGLVSAHWGGSFDPDTMGKLLQVDPHVGPPLSATVDESGQLLVSGGSGFGGYYHDDAATASVTVQGQFGTGDAIRFGAQQEFIFLDRVKDLRKLSNGKRFPPQYIENQLRSSPYIRDAIAIGDESREHVLVLINIDQQIVGRYAEAHGLAWGTFAELSQHPQVHELLRKTLVDINSRLDDHAKAKSFASFPKELDADDEELTRSRKLRRDVIEKRYASLIESMYGGDSSSPVEVLVKYRDGTQALLRQQVSITRV